VTAPFDPDKALLAAALLGAAGAAEDLGGVPWARIIVRLRLAASAESARPHVKITNEPTNRMGRFMELSSGVSLSRTAGRTAAIRRAPWHASVVTQA
jgi:hypothetical protein